MQKAIIIQDSSGKTHAEKMSLSAVGLNKYLDDGWKVLQMTPFGCSTSCDGREIGYVSSIAAILVIIEKNSPKV